LPTLYSFLTISPDIHFITNYDFSTLAKWIGYESIDYSWNNVAPNEELNIDIDSSNDAIVLLNVAPFINKKVGYFRKFFPNAKIIAYTPSEEIYQYPIEYSISKMGVNSSMFRPENLQDIEILLSPNGNTKYLYNKHGIKTDFIFFTVSKWLIEKIEEYKKNHFVKTYDEKTIDIISLQKICDSSYRKKIYNFLKNKYTLSGFSQHPRINPTWNGTKVCYHNSYKEFNDQNNFTFLFDLYNNSKVTLGTTSFPSDHRGPDTVLQKEMFLYPAIVEQRRHMKGMRDWIGPFFDSVLLSDDNPDIINQQPCVRTHRYGDCADLDNELQNILQHGEMRKIYLKEQKDWIVKNTFIDQLYRLFIKYDILPKKKNDE